MISDGPKFVMRETFKTAGLLTKAIELILNLQYHSHMKKPNWLPHLMIILHKVNS